MRYVEFTTKEAFAAWHDKVCAEHNIPRPGRNAKTGEINEKAQWTDAWVDPQITSDGRIVAQVPDVDITRDRLTVAKALPTVDTTLGTRPAVEPVTWTHRKPVPQRDVAEEAVDGKQRSAPRIR